MTHIDARTASDRNLPIIDVRTPGEYASQRAPRSVNVPLEHLQEAATRLAAELDSAVALMCASGTRAETARQALVEAGCEDVVVVSGGLQGWQAEGGEVVGDGTTWSMERQVRMSAGSLVLVGTLASLLWRPAVWLAAAVGGGLAFSGATNTCGLAKVLARMPWNQQDASIDTETALQRLRAASRR